MKNAVIIFRKDFRIQNNHALAKACEAEKVLPVFIYDQEMFDIPVAMGENQKWWMHKSLTALSEQFANHGEKIFFFKGPWLEIIKKICSKIEVQSIFVNETFEPSWQSKDVELKRFCDQNQIEFESCSGYLMVKPEKVLNSSSNPFSLYTPFWRNAQADLDLETVAVNLDKIDFYKKSPDVSTQVEIDDLVETTKDFSELEKVWEPGEKAAMKRLKKFISSQLSSYEIDRDFAAIDGTSLMSPHLHFGEITPAQIVEKIRENFKSNSSSQKYISELGWREFSYYLLHYHPALSRKGLKPLFKDFEWRHSKKDLQAWQNGQTGFPIIDAAMRQLNTIGWMHNRMRMVVASFLIKNLHIDWRVGAEYFYQNLVDADWANNYASWQWVAGCGTDATPYFRVFNPYLQAKKFDPDAKYIKTWVPELAKISAKDILNQDSQLIYCKKIVDLKKSAQEFISLVKAGKMQD